MGVSGSDEVEHKIIGKKGHKIAKTADGFSTQILKSPIW